MGLTKYFLILYLVTSIGFKSFAYTASTSLYLEKKTSSFNLTLLEKELSENKYETISAFLKMLRLKYSDYMSHYTMVFDSNSLQGASPENPRVLIYGEDASFIISFNGSPSQRAYQNIEILRFDFDKAEFFFHEVTFKLDLQARLNHTPFEEMDGLEKLDLSEYTNENNSLPRSPTICLTCHTPEKKPNWDSYPSWPGTYGSTDTLAMMPSLELNKKNILLAVIKNREKHFDTHERYQYLPGLDKFFEFRGNTAYNEPFTQGNLRLTERLQNLNFKRMARKWVLSPLFNKYKVSLIAAINNCIYDLQSFQRFIPIGHKYVFKDFLDIQKDTVEKIDGNRTLKQKQVYDLEFPELTEKEKGNQYKYSELTTIFQALDADQHIPQVRFVVEKLMSISMYNDSMSFNAGTYDFLTPSNQNVLLYDNVLEAIEKYDTTFYNRILEQNFNIIYSYNLRNSRTPEEIATCERIANLISP